MKDVKYLNDFIDRTFHTFEKFNSTVFADNFAEMEKQALKINSWGKNIYVKIPVINSKGKFTGQLIKKLNKKKIKLNITAVYTANQVTKIINNVNKKNRAIKFIASRVKMSKAQIATCL